jgi:uncharacterized protein (DUF169 family)
MTDFAAIERTLSAALALHRLPVAVRYLDAAPQGIEKFGGSAPSGCTYWRLAQEGRSFYTVPGDHYNCPIGCHTHAIALPPERAHELAGVLQVMADAGYIRMEEVAAIPRLDRGPAAVVYSPLAASAGAPDVVLFSVRPKQLMLLQEAASRAGVASTVPLMARPTCAALAVARNGAAVSSACIGNRVYTGLGEDEMYFAVRGAAIESVAAELATIQSANEMLAGYHAARRSQLASA